MYYTLQNYVFNKLPTINQINVLQIFMKMDEILEFCISRIAGFRSTMFCLLDINSEISSSLTHGKLIFNRVASQYDTSQGKFVTKKNYGSSAHLQELLSYNNECDLESAEFIKKIYKIYNCWSAGFIDLGDISNLNLCRATYEAIIENFTTITKTYVEDCLQLSRLRESFDAEENSEKVNHIAEQIEKVEERLKIVEMTVGCPREKLWFVCKQVSGELRAYFALKERIYTAYLRIVYKAARDKARVEHQVEENFQNGSIGLLRAISTYNGTRGVFSSYAKTWTMQHLLLKIKEESNVIKLPISMWQAGNDLDSIQNKLSVDSEGEHVDPDHIAEEAGIDVDRVMKVFDFINSTKVVSVENSLSIDHSEENKNEESYDPYEVTNFIGSHLDLLTDEQAFVVFLSYGLWDRLPGEIPPEGSALDAERSRQQAALRSL